MTVRAPRMRPRASMVVVALALAAGAAAMTACGSSSDDATGRPTVLAAASLADVLPRIQPAARFSFGGSDHLAFQLAQGAPADVLVSASPRYTQALFRRGLVRRPRAVATNAVVMVVPRANPAGITRLQQVARPGVKLVMAAPGVPAGDYARTALRTLGLAGALGNVASQEPDVKGVLAKVAYGDADAGFVYATDARTAPDAVRVFRLPPSAAPRALYEAAVVSGSRQPRAAQAFVDALASPDGRSRLRAAGFGVPAS